MQFDWIFCVRTCKFFWNPAWYGSLEQSTDLHSCVGTWPSGPFSAPTSTRYPSHPDQAETSQGRSLRVSAARIRRQKRWPRGILTSWRGYSPASREKFQSPNAWVRSSRLLETFAWERSLAEKNRVWLAFYFTNIRADEIMPCFRIR